MNADGAIGDHIHLTNVASKGKSGRIIALNKELKKQLIKVRELDGIDRADSEQFVIWTRRRQGTTAQVIVNAFCEWYRKLGFVGCSSHSGRRSFITHAARKASLVGGSLRDVQASVWTCFIDDYLSLHRDGCRSAMEVGKHHLGSETRSLTKLGIVIIRNGCCNINLNCGVI
jgi:integrase